METHLAEWIKGTQDGDDAESILRACVHCGFCNATCPTYQVLGDELDGPRGRIYQIKQVLEGAAPTQSTQLHLDRCLTCLNCETTCPSGVRYGRLVDIGRMEVERRVGRGAFDSAKRKVLRFVLTRHWIFDPAVKLGRALRWLLPSSLRKKLPPARDARATPHESHTRKVILLNGCVQPALMPAIDSATLRVLDALGVEGFVAGDSGCCGAIDYHLNAHDAARVKMRRNIDAWWPLIEAGAEAIVANASGCGAMLKDYAHALRDDPDYAKKAARIVAITRDLSEFVTPLIETLTEKTVRQKMCVAFHPPCTLQHTQKIRGVVESILASLGAELVPVADAHLCCGSAGTYSILQPELSRELRSRKLDSLQRNAPEIILSANIGCLSHLESGASVPVRHWIEWVDQRLRGNDS
jgi:glycolate oxidase iron-sulfur subunit